MTNKFSPELLTPWSRWRHSKSKSTYTVLGVAVEMTNNSFEYNQGKVVYVSDTYQGMRVRLVEEFLDGRFVPIPVGPLPDSTVPTSNTVPPSVEAPPPKPVGKLTLEEAKEHYRCRICGEKVLVGACPKGWREEFGEQVYPEHVVLDFGEEFAHGRCLGREAPKPC